MKRFVILLTACFLILASVRACGAKKEEPPKAQVFLFLLIQCERPLAFIFMASDGSSRYVGMDDREAINQIIAQVPKDNRYGIALPDPEAGCTEDPIST